jgi:hypothetical protein
MRTKTLLLTAALAAAGIASSMAQAVYSVNAVGYVNTTINPGLNLISNPLNATDNSIPAVFASLPTGAQVYVFNGTGFDTYGKTPFGWSPTTAANVQVAPGTGVFVRNPAAATTVTFVGEVPQGTASNTSVPAGLSIQSSAVPQDGLAATDLKYPIATGDQIFKWNGNGYDTYGKTPFGWSSPGGTLEPTIKVGEAFFARKNAQAAWTRNFSVNG